MKYIWNVAYTVKDGPGIRFDVFDICFEMPEDSTPTIVEAALRKAVAEGRIYEIEAITSMRRLGKLSIITP